MVIGDTTVLWTFILIALLGAVSWRDWREGIVPDGVNAALAATGLVHAGLSGGGAIVSALAGAALGLGVFALVRWAYFRWRGMHGLGLGDVKLFAAAGAWVGPFGLASVLLVASFSGLMFVVVRQRVQGGATQKDRLAFGPHLAAGTAWVWLLGPLGAGL